MARRTQPKTPTLTSWAEVDEALRAIGECENCIAEIQAEQNRKEAEIKAAAAQAAAPYLEKAKLQEQLVKEYVAAHRAELDGKTKKLNHGQTGYRKSTRCVVSRGAEPDVIRALRERDMLECIQVKESVNKDALKQYPGDIVVAVGASIVVDDKFWCEAAHDELQDTEATGT